MTVNQHKHNGLLWRILKPVLDAALVVASFGIAYYVRYDVQWLRQVEPQFLVPFTVYLPSVLTLAAITLFVYWLEGSYRPERGRTLFDELYIIFRGSVTAVASMIVIVFVATPGYYSRLIFGYTGIAIWLLVSATRTAEHQIVSARRRAGRGVVRVLIVGVGEVARSVMRAIVARPELGYQIAGFVDDDPSTQIDIGPYPALGSTQRLPELIHSCNVDEVIITLPWHQHRQILDIMRLCASDRVKIRIVPDLFQMTVRTVLVGNLDGIPLLGVHERALSSWQVAFKRGFDIILSVLALLIAAPLMILIAIAIKLDSPGPIVFKQVRVGRDGKLFTCNKFRSMCQDADKQRASLEEHNEVSGPIFKMRHDPRRTRVGRFLRRTSLDELPQIFNVLKGDMSIIGPRPPVPSEVQVYEPWQLRRLEVSPGITGLWQVSGRSNLSFDEMVLLDVYYVENWSPALDLRILLKTVPTVLFCSGAY